VKGSSVFGWSLSLGALHLPRLSLSIPRLFFLPLPLYCPEVSIAIRLGLSKSYKRGMDGKFIQIEYLSCLCSTILIGTSSIRIHLSLLTSPWL
jgi:hypothetical protein